MQVIRLENAVSNKTVKIKQNKNRESERHEGAERKIELNSIITETSADPLGSSELEVILQSFLELK